MKRLVQRGRRLVDREFVTGERELRPDGYEPLLERVYGEGIDLEAFDGAVDAVMDSAASESPEADRELASRLHEALPLSRRLASDAGVWRFLAVIRRPDYVRFRWGTEDFESTRRRYWSLGTRPDSNAFARLWWIAELTESGGDYWLTRRVLGNTNLANVIFVRSFSRYRPAVKAFVEVMGEEGREEIARVAKQMHTALSTMPLEGMREAELVDMVEALGG